MGSSASVILAFCYKLVGRFNLREGLKPEDDRLSKSLHKALRDSGQTIAEEELDFMLKDYYNLRGWDKKGVV